jgi:tRNA threonylcarbamoyladenosine biosynthesis protein TsaB
MKILAIETTTKFLTLAISDNGKVCEYSLEVGTRMSSLLVPTIKRILEAKGLGIEDMDYFACGLGPGSFTGIRLGLSTIKAFGWSLNKPIIGISTLDIIARNAPLTDKEIIPVIDAKRGMVYCCSYKFKNGMLTKSMPYKLLSPGEFYRKIKPGALVFGDAINLYRDAIASKEPGVKFLDKDTWYPKGRNIITIAEDKIKKGEVGDCFKINPIYLYPKECQIRKPLSYKKGN